MIAMGHPDSMSQACGQSSIASARGDVQCNQADPVQRQPRLYTLWAFVSWSAQSDFFFFVFFK